jgi:hypothetical protein
VPLNVPQQLFLSQARSDYDIFLFLGRRDACHRLHYLQMSTEKLAKVYFWRHGQSPGPGHHKFGPFLRDLDTSRAADFHLMFGYKDPRRFYVTKVSIIALAERIQNLAPAGGNTGPNPEYPWPPNMPIASPLTHVFPEWQEWNDSVAGRRLRYFVENLLRDYVAFFP